MLEVMRRLYYSKVYDDGGRAADDRRRRNKPFPEIRDREMNRGAASEERNLNREADGAGERVRRGG